MSENPLRCGLCAVVSGDSSLDLSLLNGHLCPKCFVRGAILESLVELRNKISDGWVESDLRSISDRELTAGVVTALTALEATGLRRDISRPFLEREFGKKLLVSEVDETSDGQPSRSLLSFGSCKRWWPLAIALVVLITVVGVGIALHKNQGRKEVEKRNISSQLGHRGQQAFRDRKWELAIHCFSQFLRMQPSNASAFYMRAISRFHLGNRDGAVEDLEKAVRLAPENERYRKAIEKLRNPYVPAGHEK